MRKLLTCLPQTLCGTGRRTFMRLAVLMLVCMTAISGWADETITLSTKSGNGTLSGSTYTGATNDYADLTVSYTGTSSKENSFYLNNGYLQLKAAKSDNYEATVTVTPKTGYTISKVAFTYSGGKNPTCATCTATNATWSSTDFTLTPTDGSQAVSLKMVPNGSSELNVRIATVVVTYTTSESTLPTPTLSFGTSSTAKYKVGDVVSFPTATVSLSDNSTYSGDNPTYTLNAGTTGLTLNSDGTGFDNATPTASGEATITASLAAQDGVCAAAENVTYKITVTNRQFADIEAISTELTIEGTTYSTLDLRTLNIESSANDADDATKAISSPSVTYAITSGDDNVTLSGSTLTAKAVGSAVITATLSATNYDLKDVTINVTVSEVKKDMTVSATPTSIDVIEDISMDVKDQFTVTAPTDYDITLTSSDESVATVSGTTVTGVEAGSTTISYTLTAKGYNDVTGQFTVNVTALPTPVITISDVTVTKEYTFEPKVESVVVTLADGTTKMLTDYDITYVSSETGKITVSTDGKSLTTQRNGDEEGVKITATVKGDGETYGDATTTFLVKILSSTKKIVVTIPSEMYTIYTGDANSITVSPQLMATNGPVALGAANVEYTVTSGDKNVSFTTNDNHEIEITGLTAGTATIKVKVKSVENRYSEGTATITVVVIDAANTITDPTLSPATGSVEISGSSEGSIDVTITNTYAGATVYYTTDGSDPSTSSTRTAFESTTKDATVKVILTSSEETTKTIRAIAVATIDGVEVSSNEVGGAYTFAKKAEKALDKVTQTFSGLYDAGDRIETPSIVMTFGGVPENDKDDAWDEFTKVQGKGNTVGTDERYTVTSENDALVEATPDKEGKTDGSLDNSGQKYEYKHYKSSDAYSVSQRVANLPAYGDYYKFEPTMDGTLTLHAQQQGSIYTDGKDSNGKKTNDYSKIRLRPVYFVDETGMAQKATNATTKSRLDSDWKSLSEDGFNGSDVNTTGESMYTTEQMKNIYNFFVTYLKGLYMKANNVTEISKVTVKDAYTMIDNSNYNPIFVLNPEDGKTFTAPNGTTEKVNSAPSAAEYTTTEKGLISTLQSYMDCETVGGTAQKAVNDGTGYFLMTEGYVDYTFDVKAGKTYYFFGNRTKVGLAGFEFQPVATNADNSTLELANTNTSENTSAISEKINQTVNATVKRPFAESNWYSLVLPFSVTTTQLHKQLCGSADHEATQGANKESGLPNECGIKDVQILYFDRIENNTLYLHRYFHQMIPAGTPVFILAKKTTSSLTFTNVLVDATDVTAVEDSKGSMGGSGEVYKLDGSFNTWYAQPNDYVLLNSQYGVTDAGTGKFMQYTGTSQLALGAMTATISGCASGNKLSVIGLGGDDDEDVSGVIETLADTTAKGAVSGNDAIYNLNGQVVGHGLELYTLPKGIYITGGKKHIVR